MATKPEKKLDNGLLGEFEVWGILSIFALFGWALVAKLIGVSAAVFGGGLVLIPLLIAFLMARHNHVQSNGGWSTVPAKA